MFSLVGKIVMACIWIAMIVNLVMPFRHPANICFNCALIFFCIVHGMQVWLYRATLKPGEKATAESWGLFFFGAFAAMSWKKKMLAQSQNNEQVK